MDRNTTGSFGGSSTASSTRRRQMDFMKLAGNPRHVVTPTDNVGEFYVLFQGPAETPYEGGWWNVHVTLSETYPYRSPSIGFGNRIYHPNVDEHSGSVCLDVINQTWTPMYDLANVFDMFLPQLLRYPNPADPLNPEAASILLHNPAAYMTRVQEHVCRHGTLLCAQSAVKHLVSPTQHTPSKDVNAVETSPATTFASRGLSDTPSSLEDSRTPDDGEAPFRCEEEIDDEEEEIPEIEL